MVLYNIGKFPQNQAPTQTCHWNAGKIYSKQIVNLKNLIQHTYITDFYQITSNYCSESENSNLFWDVYVSFVCFVLILCDTKRFVWALCELTGIQIKQKHEQLGSKQTPISVFQSQQVVHTVAPMWTEWGHLVEPSLHFFSLSVKSEQSEQQKKEDILCFSVRLKWGFLINGLHLYQLPPSCWSSFRERELSQLMSMLHTNKKQTCHSSPPHYTHNALLLPRIPCRVSSVALSMQHL